MEQKNPANNSGEVERKTCVCGRAQIDAVALPVPLELHLIDRLNSGEPIKPAHTRRSKLIEFNYHSPPLIHFLRSRNITRVFCLSFRFVDSSKYRAFLRRPADFLTLSDIYLICAATGATLGRVIDLLTRGQLTEDTATGPAPRGGKVQRMPVTLAEMLDSPTASQEE